MCAVSLTLLKEPTEGGFGIQVFRYTQEVFKLVLLELDPWKYTAAFCASLVPVCIVRGSWIIGIARRKQATMEGVARLSDITSVQFIFDLLSIAIVKQLFSFSLCSFSDTARAPYLLADPAFCVRLYSKLQSLLLDGLALRFGICGFRQQSRGSQSEQRL